MASKRNSDNISKNIPGLRTKIDAKETLSRKELISIIKELNEDFPEKNVTRALFRQEVGPDSIWIGEFGSFPEYQKAANLSYSREVSRMISRTAKHASVDQFREEDGRRQSYGQRFLKAEDKGRWKTIVAVSDMHDIECDPFYRRVAMETVKKIQPDVVCLDGDIFDCAEFSIHFKDPRDWNVEDHVMAGQNIVRDFREAAPNAQIDLIEGNHEYRLVRETLSNSPALAALLDLRGVGVDMLFGLSEYECNYIAKGTLCTFSNAEKLAEVAKNYRIYYDAIYATHFPEGRLKSGYPGFSGHHHKHIVWTEQNSHFGSYEWHQMGAGHKRTASYCDGSQWNSGFLIVEIDTWSKQSNFEYVTVGTTMAKAAGDFYYREKEEFYPILLEELPNGKWTA